MSNGNSLRDRSDLNFSSCCKVKKAMDSSAELRICVNKIIFPTLFHKSVFSLLALFSFFSFVMCTSNNYGTPLGKNVDTLPITTHGNYPRLIASRNPTNQCDE